MAVIGEQRTSNIRCLRSVNGPKADTEPNAPQFLFAASATIRLAMPRGKDMRRREFLGAFGGATVAASMPLAAHAQQPRKPPTIGFLGQTTPVAESPRLAPFLERLRELG